MLHPFIPFLTEEIWLKNKLDNNKKDFLMFTNWSEKSVKEDKDYKDVNKIINIISEIRSFKNQINVPPGSFIDLSLQKIKNKDKIFLKKNDFIIKKLGRINTFMDKDKNQQSATLVISGDIFKLYFDQGIDLNLIKENLLDKLKKTEVDLTKISERLANKAFVSRAPKNIVDQEKINYSDLKKDLEKISLIIESL